MAYAYGVWTSFINTIDNTVTSTMRSRCLITCSSYQICILYFNLLLEYLGH